MGLRAGLLTVILLQDAAGIVSAETERVAQCGADGTFLCLVEGKVQIVVNILVAVIVLVVDGGRNDVVLHGQTADKRLNTAGRTEQVACH